MVYLEFDTRKSIQTTPSGMNETGFERQSVTAAYSVRWSHLGHIPIFATRIFFYFFIRISLTKRLIQKKKKENFLTKEKTGWHTFTGTMIFYELLCEFTMQSMRKNVRMLFHKYKGKRTLGKKMRPL